MSSRNAEHIGVHPARVKRSLQETRGWARFLSVVGFLFGPAFLFAGIWLLRIRGNDAFTGLVQFLGVVLILSALLVLPVAFGLHTYARRIGRLLPASGESILMEALEAHRVLWKFIGVVVEFVICFLAVVCLFVLLAHLAH